MIIGENDQRLSENNYYESPQKFEVLKRKFATNENVNSGETLNNFSDRSAPINFENKANEKMHYVDNTIEHYQTYQATEIHQDGGQSYINLTVLTPTLVPYEKNETNHHNQHLQQQATQYTSNIQQRDEIKAPPTTTNNNKYEVRNYQQQQQQQPGKQTCDN